MDVAGQKCQEFRLRMDAHLGSSLAEDQSQALLAHISECSTCAAEFTARHSLRSKLKHAVHSVPEPAFLETRVRASLREPRRSPLWKLSLVAASAVVVVAGAGFGVVFQQGYFRTTPSSQESYIASVSDRVGPFMKVGLGDHVHCAVFRKYPKNPPTMQQMTAQMGPQYAGIIPIVRKHVPSDYRLWLAHRCTYHGRRFVHLVLRSDDRLLSVILTRKSAGEGISESELAPVIAEASVQRFQIAAFQTHDHMVYIISDAPRQQNLAMMQAMAPSLRAYLTKLES